MKVLLVGAGAVGEAIAVLARRSDPDGSWLEGMVVSDYDLERAREVAAETGDRRFVPERVDAGNPDEIERLCRKHEADFIMNACAPNFNMPVFHAAFGAGCTYMDMAMSLSERHPEAPYAETHVKLGDRQFEEAGKWEHAGLLAVLGSGVEPGMVNVFARYAGDHLFDQIHELNVRDGDNLRVEGMEIAFGFSIWTTIEECLNPPVVWERGCGAVPSSTVWTRAFAPGSRRWRPWAWTRPRRSGWEMSWWRPGTWWRRPHRIRPESAI